MYAVIKTGGKQYRVKAGDLLVVEKLDGDPGASVTFGEVLMLGDGAGVTVGAPTVDGAVVGATLIETRKGEKIKVFKKIRRQGYRRTGGHRQLESVLRVVSVGLKGKEDKWDGEVDLTTKAELNARARGLKIAAPKPAKAEAKPAPKAEAPKAQAKPAAPKKAAEPKAEAAPKTQAKAETAPKADAKPKAQAKPKAEAPAKEAKAAAPKKAPAKKAAPAKAEGQAKAPAKKAAPKAAAKKDDGKA